MNTNPHDTWARERVAACIEACTAMALDAFNTVAWLDEVLALWSARP